MYTDQNKFISFQVKGRHRDVLVGGRHFLIFPQYITSRTKPLKQFQQLYAGAYKCAACVGRSQALTHSVPSLVRQRDKKGVAFNTAAAIHERTTL